MRQLHLVAIAMLLASAVAANNITEEDRQNFIDKYAAIAITEMKFSGIPASITLAQAILESNWGYSTIAGNANNFFCIKCFNGWDGDTFEAKDDEPGLSCFRKYTSVWQSFRDHSVFLKEGKRYQPLFELEKTDFRGWALGLKECGYATDGAYGQKLVSLIEDYGLWVYDYAIPAEFFPAIEAPEMQVVEEVKVEAPIAPATTEENENRFLAASENKQQGVVLSVPMYKIEETSEPVSEVKEMFERPQRPAIVGKKIRPIVPHLSAIPQWD